MFYVLLCVTLCPLYFFNHLDGEERAGCFALLDFLVFHKTKYFKSYLCLIVIPYKSSNCMTRP